MINHTNLLMILLPIQSKLLTRLLSRRDKMQLMLKKMQMHGDME
jgi:hypothetical protein